MVETFDSLRNNKQLRSRLIVSLLESGIPEYLVALFVVLSDDQVVQLAHFILLSMGCKLSQKKKN